MNTPYEEKLMEMLKEIQIDIRQIKADVQSVIKQQPKAAPVYLADSDGVSESGEASISTSVEDVLRYFREKRGDDDLGTD